VPTEKPGWQGGKDRLSAREFVAFPLGGNLSQHGAGPVGEGGDQMNARHFLAVHAAQRLAINCNGFACLEPLCGKPLAQYLLKGCLVELPKHPMHGRSARTTLPLEAQRRANLGATVLAPLAHRVLAAGATQHGTDGYGQHTTQGVFSSLTPPHIW